MPPPKSTRLRGRKSNKVLEQPRSYWVPDNRTRRSCRTDQERQLWDLQDQLLALRGESEAQQLSKIDEAIAFLYPYRGRAEQLKALRWLLFEEKDMILVARTSFGKSMIMQAMPCLLRASVVIIILPLNAIGAEQKAKIKELPGTKPVHVCAETISARLLAEIRIGVYTHILISPELLVGKKFHKILTHPAFRIHVGLVVIDEVHLVANWGSSFRSSYTQLWKARSLLGQRPWFACTATLDDTTFKIVQELAGFRDDINMVRTSINRPDLSIIREYVKRGNKKSFKSLYFVIDRAYEEAPVRNISSAPIGPVPSQISATSAEQRIQYTPTPHRIPKTIIFLDSKEMILLCRDSIRSWLVYYRYQEAQARKTVQLYHATLAIADKSRLYEEFRKPNSEIRILVSSDALAHGADIPDIKRSVQFCMPKDKSINMLWQRFGRAARGSDQTGEAIFLIEDWYKGPREDIAGPAKSRGRAGRAFQSQPSQLSREYRVVREVSQEDGVADFASDISSRISVCSNADSNASASDIGRELSPGGTSAVLLADTLLKKSARRRKTDVEKRAALSLCIYAFANEEKSCLRKIILENYKEQSPSAGGQGCCSNCDPNLRAFKEFNIRKPPAEGIPRKMQQKAFAASIKNWICNWVEKKYQHLFWNPTWSYVISDKQIVALCSCAWYITSHEALKKNLPDWNCDQLGDNLDEFITFIQVEVEKANQTESQLLALASKSKDSAERILPRSRVAERGVESAAQSPQTQGAQLLQSISAENQHAGLLTPSPSQPTSSRNAQLASPNSSQQNASWPSTPNPHYGYQSWQRDNRVQFLIQGGYPGSQSQAVYQQSWGNNQHQLSSSTEYRHPTPLGYQSLYYNNTHQLPAAPRCPSLHYSIRNQSPGQARYYNSQGCSASQPLERSRYQSSQRSIEFQNSQRSTGSPLLENSKAQDLGCDTESPPLRTSEAQDLGADTQYPPSRLCVDQNLRADSRSPPSDLCAAQDLQADARSPPLLSGVTQVQPVDVQSPPLVLGATQLQQVGVQPPPSVLDATLVPQVGVQHPPSALGATQLRRVGIQSPPSVLGAAHSSRVDIRALNSDISTALSLQDHSLPPSSSYYVVVPSSNQYPDVKDRSFPRRSTRSSSAWLKLGQRSNQYPDVECQSPHAQLHSSSDSHLEGHQDIICSSRATVPQASQPISDPPHSKRKRKDESAHFNTPQPGGDSILTSLRKSTRRRPLTLISGNLAVKDVRVTNKRARGS